MDRRSLIKHAGIAGVLAAGAAPAVHAQAAIRWRLASSFPKALDTIYGAADVFAKKVGEMKYEGYSSCPLVTGYSKMVLAEFKYDNVRDSDPLISTFVDTSKEQYSMWLLKKYVLPRMYWDMMLRGRA